MADNFSDVSDIFSDSGSDSEYSVIRRRRPQKIVHPFSYYNESDSSDVDNNNIYDFGCNTCIKIHKSTSL